MSSIRSAVPVAALSLITLSLATAVGAQQDLPEEFQQIIPRGRIAAIDEPRFVQADEARLPDGAWVLGVVDGGEARAYSLNLLNRHEVVNDRLAGRPIAAVCSIYQSVNADKQFCRVLLGEAVTHPFVRV